jgi:hypothetical protein
MSEQGELNLEEIINDYYCSHQTHNFKMSEQSTLHFITTKYRPHKTLLNKKSLSRWAEAYMLIKTTTN